MNRVVADSSRFLPNGLPAPRSKATRQAGWRWVNLGRLMASKLGSVDPSRHQDEIFVLYSVPAFDQQEPEVLPGRKIGSAKQVVQAGDVLLFKIVPHIRRSWVVSGHSGSRIIASGEWIVFRSEMVWPDYLRHLLVSDDFHEECMRTTSGVGGVPIAK